MVTVKEAKKMGLYQGDENTELSMTSLLITKFFGATLPKGQDYRDAVVEYALDKKLNIASDNNIVEEMFSTVFKPKCPTCNDEMFHLGGSGNGDTMTQRYRCHCGFEVSVTLVSQHGVRFNFK